MTTYPKPVSQRSGCKVAWYTYATKADADQASTAAVEQAVTMAKAGYDFGWQSPGEVRANADGTFTVTIP